MNTNRFVTTFALLGLFLTGSAQAAAVSTPQKQQIETVVREYLMNNPEVVVQSLQTYQQKQMDQAQKTIQNTQKNSPKFVNDLFHENNDPVAGNADGKITLVQFFDYQCPHCVDMAPLIEDLVKNNSSVKIVFKEFPIRGPVSEFAARAALAANMQGKYFDFHKGLMETKQQPLTQDAILVIAKSVGIDTDKLKTDMDSAAVSAQLKKNYKLAQDLQLLGTPALFIAKSSVTNKSAPTEIIFVPGQVSNEQLAEMLKKLN